MKTIISSGEQEIIINKSRFITNSKFINDEESAKAFIEEVRLKYPDARHHCYVYIIGNVVRISDDGEPASTAGQPMLEVCRHHDLANIVIVVTRYFGGIKLGAGGLTRAYTKSVSNLILNSEISAIVPGYKINLVFMHSDTNVINYFLKQNDYEVLDKDFGLKITYSIDVEVADFDTFTKNIKAINHQIKIDVIKDDIYLIKSQKNG